MLHFTTFLYMCNGQKQVMASFFYPLRFPNSLVPRIVVDFVETTLSGHAADLTCANDRNIY